MKKSFEIRGKATGHLDMVKRFWLDGIHTKQTCPKCDHVDDWQQFDGNTYSYPAINAWETVRLYCDQCGHEWSIQSKLTIDLETRELE